MSWHFGRSELADAGAALQAQGSGKDRGNCCFSGRQRPHKHKDPNVVYSIWCRVYGMWYIVYGI